MANRLGMRVGVSLVAVAAMRGWGQVAPGGAGAAGTGAGNGSAGAGAGAAGVAGAGGQRRPQGPAIGVPTLGMPGVHDPSTVVRFHGRYYVYTTGRGIPMISSADGETWTREGSVFAQIPEAVHAAVPKNNGTDVWAPDLVRVGGGFYMYYAVSSWGSFQSVVALATNPVLDPKDPAYKWTDRGVVVGSDGVEELNAIDPGVILAADGTLWICYGSYHGTIDLVQLDPKTGLRIAPQSPVTVIASGSEASDIIFHDGYYYLFVNHGSCCKGKDSQYNIRVGRSAKITGPYVDKHGEALTKAAGVMFLAAHDHRIGPGHFGRVLDYDASANGMEADGAERFSLHYEADMTRGGRSVLDVRPLLWSLDGWPVAGDNVADGTYQLVSRAGENTLEEHVAAPAAKVGGAGVGAVPAPAPVAEGLEAPVLRMTRYLTLDNERWTIAAAGGGFYKVVNAATGDAIGVTAGVVGLRVYVGADGQMWRLEEFPDGSYALRNKVDGAALGVGVGRDANAVGVGKFVRDEAHLWVITTP